MSPLQVISRVSPAFALFFGVWSVNLIPLRRDHSKHSMIRNCGSKIEA